MKKNENNVTTSLAVKILAGVMAALMLSGTVFALIAYLQ